jgi:peptidoglycan/xylan/chitin deacetylase (PgdA/CDA1 family)
VVSGGDVALTFDDLPGRGAWPLAADRLATVDELVAALARHGVAGAYGFANAGVLAGAPDAATVLDRWTAAGHRLGNHTYSHLDLHASPEPSAFLRDIEANEAALEKWQGPGGGGARMFRFPYLNAGETDAQCHGVDRYLRDRGYTAADVTVDFADWRWNRRPGGDRAGFVGAGIGALRQAKTLAGVLFQRRIAHVLLLHFGMATARYLDDLLGAYADAGVRFVTLEEALADPAYATPIPARPRAGTLLNRLGRTARVAEARS